MIVPSISPRIEQTENGKPVSVGIYRRYVRTLGQVASTARKRQILNIVCTSMLASPNVVYVHWVPQMRCGKLAVFATKPSPLEHQRSLFYLGHHAAALPSRRRAFKRINDKMSPTSMLRLYCSRSSALKDPSLALRPSSSIRASTDSGYSSVTSRSSDSLGKQAANASSMPSTRSSGSSGGFM